MKLDLNLGSEMLTWEWQIFEQGEAMDDIEIVF